MLRRYTAPADNISALRATHLRLRSTAQISLDAGECLWISEPAPNRSLFGRFWCLSRVDECYTPPGAPCSWSRNPRDRTGPASRDTYPNRTPGPSACADSKFRLSCLVRRRFLDPV